VGFVILLSGVVLIIGILAVGRESRLFTRKVEYWSSFSNVAGLAEGSPVQLVGVQVGTVSRVEFSTDLQIRGIRVTLEVDRDFADRIRRGTEARIKSLSYLSQERFVELTTGDSDQPMLEPGTEIPVGVSRLAALTEQGTGIADDVEEITRHLKELLLALNEGEGVLSELLRNPDFGRSGIKDLNAAMSSLRRVATKIENGEGLMGRMLADEGYAVEQLGQIEASLGDIRVLLEKANEEGGTLTEFLSPEGKGMQVVDSLVTISTDLKSITKEMGEGKGLLGRLASDDESAERILSNLEKTTAHLASITGKIDGGEGTLGAIINDSEVYEGLRDVVGGIRKSRFGKGMVRHYGKKGSKAREVEEAAEDP